MSPFPIINHEFVVLHSIIERVSRTRDTQTLITSPCEPLAITQTFEEANKVLEYYKKKITSRKGKDGFSLCFWYETIDGVDIARVPRGRNVVEEVRLRVMGADVWGRKEDGEDGRVGTVVSNAKGQGDGCAEQGYGEGGSARAKDDRDGRSESQEPSHGQGYGHGESRDDQDATDEYFQTDQPELRTPHPDGQTYNFEKTRLRLRNAAPKWKLGVTETNSDQASDQHQPADVPLESSGFPILPRGLRAFSIDGRVWTTKYSQQVTDAAYLRWKADKIEASTSWTA